MKTEITDLAKSLGIKKIGPLKFRDDDNLYKKFQKLIKYVYKNGDWNNADTTEALKKMFEYRIMETNGTLERIALDDISIPKYKVTEGFSSEVYEYRWGEKSTNGEPFVTYLFVDTDNHSGANHGKRFKGPDILGRTGRVSSASISDKEGMLFNVDRLVGFSQVEKLLIDEYQKQRSTLNFSEREFRNYLRILVDPSMAAKKEAWRFSENKELYGDMVEFIDNYVGSVYEIVVQHDYEKNLESQFRADPSTTKLNINEETQRVMDNTELKQYFDFVELDNEVDLKRFEDFETEMQRVQSVLPAVEGVKPDLRLRKLGNYKATGLYFPFNKTIAIDFRSDSTENRGEYRPSEPGIQSFIHEYGHFLDYNLSKDEGFMNSLSLEPEFKKIIDKYVEQLKINGIYDRSHGKTDNYYAVPTEVFARSFEVYAFEKGLRSSLMGDNYSQDPEYVSFIPEIREEITKYFDEKIPGFGDRIRSLVEKEKVEEQGIDQGEFENEGTKKKDDSHTPSLQPEVEGSGQPVQELDQKFVRPPVDNSNIDNTSSIVENNKNLEIEDIDTQEIFTVSLTKKPLKRLGFHVADQDELGVVNEYSQQLREAAKFYKDNMSKGNIVYVFKQNDEIKALRVKYGEENFSHLTGIKFDRRSAKGMLNDLVEGKTDQNAILVKNDGTTFQKLEAIDKLPEVIEASIISLNDLNSVEQAQKLRFSDALKTTDNKLLLALKDFEPEVYRPYSLINLSGPRTGYSNYSEVPENTVLAVLSETRSEFGGISIGTLSINHDYVKNTADAMEIINVMNDLSIKELEKEERSQEKKIEEKTPDEKAEESAKNPAVKENEVPDETQDSYQLQRAQGKLERLQKEFDEVDEQLTDHIEMTNGQPMNDKRNGASWFKRNEQLEEKYSRLRQEIEEQKQRIEKLKKRDYNKANGLNRRGNGLEISVDNIPRIREEIEKFERGGSNYTKDTIQRYQRELANLEEMTKINTNELTPGAQKLIDDGLVRQWKKKPTIYFVTDREFKRLALELNEKGEFEESKRYLAMYEAAEKKIAELLNMQQEVNDKELSTQEDHTREQTSAEKKTEADQNNDSTKGNEVPDNNRGANETQIEEPKPVENKPGDDQRNNIDQEKIKLTEKQIDLAKDQDILAVAQDLKIELVSDNGSYYWKEDPELVIDSRTKTFTWKKKDVYRGDSVKLVQEAKDMTFTEAVKYLNDNEIAAFDHDKVSYKLNDDQISSVQARQEENNVNADPIRTTETNKIVDTKQTTATNVPKRVSKKQIEDARNRNILEVAQELGMNLKRQGQTYNWIEHDSLVIFPKTNTYNWYSRAEAGKNPIDLVESVKGLDFKSAVAYLNDSKITEFDESKLQNEPQKPFKYLLKDSNDVSKLKMYFVKERKLSEQTVNDFLRSGILAQANRIDRVTKEFEPVAVFKHRDINGNLIGASLQGVKPNWEKYPVHGYRKEIISNSAQNRGIVYDNGLEKGQNSYKMIFFEAPIDMMSYYELHKDQLAGTRLVALNGLKDNTIGKHIVESFGFSGEPSLEELNKYFEDNGLTAADVKKRFADLGASLKIAVDNDVNGREFIEKLNKKYPLIPFESELPPMLKGREKTDWNDYLKASKTDPDFEITKESEKKVEAVDSPTITEDSMNTQVSKEQKYEDRSIKQEPAQSEEIKVSEERVEDSERLSNENSKDILEQKQTTDPTTQRTTDKEINIKEFDIETASARELGVFAMKKIREFSKDPKTWDEYMTMLGRFPEYSPRNVALIYTQAKDSQMLGTFKQWQERHDVYGLTKEDIMYDETIAAKLKEVGREYEQKLSIKSGESGKVSLFKIKKELYLPRTDEAGNILYDDNGNVKYKKYHKNQLSDLEKKLIEEKKLETKSLPARDRTGALRFVKYKAFDISQTNLKKEAYSKVAGKHLYDYETESSKLYKISYALKDYAKSNNIAYAIDKRRLTGMDPKTKGVYHDDPTNGASVLMNKNLDFNESLGTAIRLLSHGVIDKIRDKNEVLKFQRGLEAEIMGHAVAAHYGLKTEKRWLNEMSKKLQDLDDKQLSKSLSVASKTGRDFIQKIAKYSDTPKRQRDRSMKKNITNTRSRGLNM